MKKGLGLYTYMNKQFSNLYTCAWSFTFWKWTHDQFPTSFQLVYTGHLYIYILCTLIYITKTVCTLFAYPVFIPCNLFIANHLTIANSYIIYSYSYYKILFKHNECNCMHSYMLYVTKNRVSGQTVLNLMKFCADLSLLFISVISSVMQYTWNSIIAI